ncbi:MAG: hypothetical protein ABSD92_12510 [Candidatus Bathyarchaeia archaeon]|jgi:hypothetical protein
MKIANLQKGAIFLYNGVEVVGEGTGFGVPIGKYSDETFFSGSSFLQIRKQENSVIIRKEFLMDLIARDKFRNLKLENMKFRRIIDSISLLYQRHKRFAQFILRAKGLLFKFGVESTFIGATSKGKVIVTYTLDRNRVLVNLNFSLLDRNNLQKVFVLNEQGAHFFRKYTDSEGVKLDDDEIGAWKSVTAESAKIVDKQDRIGFSLKNLEGMVLRRGREVAKGSLNWIGLDYELYPENDQFEYEIEIFG